MCSYSYLIFLYAYVNSAGIPRPPFDDLIQKLLSCKSSDQIHKRSAAVVSVDIPSGWHVEKGDTNGNGIKPDMLVVISCRIIVFLLLNTLVINLQRQMHLCIGELYLLSRFL